MKGHFLVSFPRSGQHMTERMIRHVFSLQHFDYSYCEFYHSDALFRYYPEKKLGKYGHIVKKDAGWWKSELYQNRLIRRIRKDLSIHRDFKQKWVKSTAANVLPIEYYDLVLQPRVKLRQLLEHLFRGFDFEESIIERAVEVERPRLINVIPDDLYECIKRQLRTTELDDPF